MQAGRKKIALPQVARQKGHDHKKCRPHLVALNKFSNVRRADCIILPTKY